MGAKMKIKRLAILFSWFLGGILLVAAFSKTNNIVEFYEQLHKHNIFKESVGVIVFLLPGVELILGICLIFRIYWKEASLVSAILFILFLIYSVWNIENISNGCGCMKLAIPYQFKLNRWTVALRDIIFIAMSLYVFVVSASKAEAE